MTDRWEEERRQTNTALSSGANAVGLPSRVFLYTIDQLGVMLDMSERNIKSNLFYDGRDSGRRRADLMITRNIAPQGSQPDWRVAEREFVRWMRAKGFKHYEKGGFTS